MKTSYLLLLAVLTWSLVGTAESAGGVWSKAIRESVEAITKRSGKVADDAVRLVAPKATTRAATIGPSSALIVRGSDDAARAIVAKFGDDGASAVGSLSSTGAQRLAAMSDDLAASGRGGDWMHLIAKRGDEVTDWLWKRRGSVAVGTMSAAVLLQPEEFIQGLERVATTTVDAAGEHVAGPIVERAAAVIPWTALWIALVLGCLVRFTVTTRNIARLRRAWVDRAAGVSGRS